MKLEQMKNNLWNFKRLDLYGEEVYHKNGWTGEGVVIGNIDVHSSNHGPNTTSNIKNEGHIEFKGKVINYDLPETFYLSDVARQVKECMADGVDIISMQLSQQTPDKECERVMREAVNSGIHIIVSAGNDGERWNDTVNVKQYPAAYDFVTTVGAVDNKLEWCTWESHGKYIDIVGLGKAIPSKNLNGDWVQRDGTSHSTPHIARLFALELHKQRSLHHEPTPQKLKEIMQEKCLDLGPLGKDNYYGSGFITLDFEHFYKTYFSLMKLWGYAKGDLTERAYRIQRLIELGHTQQEAEDKVNPDYRMLGKTDGGIPLFEMRKESGRR